MIKCPECGIENSDNDEFCQNCGFDLMEISNDYSIDTGNWRDSPINIVLVFVIAFLILFTVFIFLYFSFGGT